MSKEEEPLPRLLLWLTTSSFAILASSAVGVGTALSLWLQERLSKSLILGAALGLAGLLLVCLWISVITTNRLRAKISKLENRAKRQCSPIDVNEDEFNVISLLTQEDPGLTVEEIGQVLGVMDSVARHFCEELDRKGLVSKTRFWGEHRRIGGPDEGYRLTPSGRKFVAESDGFRRDEQ
jgi:hypothetical protein